MLAAARGEEKGVARPVMSAFSQSIFNKVDADLPAFAAEAAATAE